VVIIGKHTQKKNISARPRAPCTGAHGQATAKLERSRAPGLRARVPGSVTCQSFWTSTYMGFERGCRMMLSPHVFHCWASFAHTAMVFIVSLGHEPVMKKWFLLPSVRLLSWWWKLVFQASFCPKTSGGNGYKKNVSVYSPKRDRTKWRRREGLN
jgi:hypothetical protein